jgi:hypothetical protein
LLQPGVPLFQLRAAFAGYTFKTYLNHDFGHAGVGIPGNAPTTLETGC